MKHSLFFLFFIFVSTISRAQLPIAAFSVDDSTICPGTCTNFTNLSTNATSYLWTFAGSFPSTSTAVHPQNVCYNTPGSYSVSLIASNANGSDTLTINNCVTVYPYPSVAGSGSHGDTLFMPQGFAQYRWYFNGVLLPNETLYWHVAIPDGMHTPVAVDSNGCEVEAADFGLVLYPDFVPSDTEFCVNTCINFTNLSIPDDTTSTNHQWHFSGGTPSTSLDFNPQNICYNTAGSYWVKLVMVYSTHSRSDSFMVNVVPCTGILENDFSSNYFSVLPNPFSSHVSIHFNQPQDSKCVLKIFNSIGELVTSKNTPMKDQTLDLSSLSQGIFLVSIISGNKIYAQKIIRQ